MFETTEMRKVFADWLGEKMENDDRVCVLDSDLARANGTLDLFKKFPDRTFDVGIAEANMACIAAGLASYGMKPYIFTFCAFATRRICDQIAISIAYANQDVKIVGTDPTITAALNGATHMTVEDIGVMRSIPNMVIFEPVDGDQLSKALPQILAYEAPIYIRLFRKVPSATYFADDDYKFDLFKADVLKEGTDVTLIASGIEVEQAMIASESLAGRGINAEVINVHTIKPIDEDTIIKSALKTKKVVTCENHNIIGGLGSAVAECLSKNAPTQMEFVGIKDRFGVVGKLPYLIDKLELSAAHIEKAVDKVLG